MIVFDTSAWIEFFIGSPKGKTAANYVYSNEEIAVSSLCLAEIQIKYEREHLPAQSRLQFIRSRCVVIDVTEEIALLAASLRLKHGLYLIDAIMYADMDEPDFWKTSLISPNEARQLERAWSVIFSLRKMAENRQKEYLFNSQQRNKSPSVIGNQSPSSPDFSDVIESPADTPRGSPNAQEESE